MKNNFKSHVTDFVFLVHNEEQKKILLKEYPEINELDISIVNNEVFDKISDIYAFSKTSYSNISIKDMSNEEFDQKYCFREIE